MTLPPLLLDENISKAMVKAIRDAEYNILSIREVHRGISDVEIIELSNQYKRIIVTFDKDFGELIYRTKAHPYGVIMLRLKEHQISIVLDALEQISNVINVKKIDLEHKFIIYTLNSIRIRNIDK